MTVADYIIRGGTILDGSGREPYLADIVVSADRIVEIGDIPSADTPELDATGLLVAPGFIDIHSHSDYTLLVDPRAVSAIHQGVTLEVIGNCGHGCFPVHDPAVARNAIYGYDDRVPLAWRRAHEYFDVLEQSGPAVNVLSLVPNGQLRLDVVGLRDRPAEAGIRPPAMHAGLRRDHTRTQRQTGWLGLPRCVYLGCLVLPPHGARDPDRHSS